MPRFSYASMRRIAQASLLGTVLGAALPALADPIPFNTFLQFSFAEAGTAAAGCDPADPAGGFCFSSDPATAFIGAPAWTFVAPTGGVTLTVIDAFLSGDRFEIFDFGANLGLTSNPVDGSDCGDSPLPCLADPSMSSAVLALGAGAHSLTIVPLLAPGGGGSAFLQVSTIPEPTSALLLSLGLAGLAARRIRGSRKAPTA